MDGELNRAARHALALVLSCSVACTHKSGEGTGSGSAAAAESEASSSDVPTTSAAGDSSGDSSSSGSSTGASAPFDAEAFAALCAAIDSQSECDAVPIVDDSGPMHWCTWETWVVVTLEDEVCQFGRVEGSCVLESAYDGCGGLGYCGPNPFGGAWRMNDRGQVEVGNATSWCVPNGSLCELQNPDVPVECTCVCDPAWPGVPP